MTINIHVGDIGTVIQLTVVDQVGAIVDVSSALPSGRKNFKFLKPRTKTVLVKTSSFTTNGVDGVLEYTTVADDLDEDGPWQVQVDLKLNSGEWHSAKVFFPVAPNIS